MLVPLLGPGLGAAEASSAFLSNECSVFVMKKPTKGHSKQVPLKRSIQPRFQ